MRGFNWWPDEQPSDEIKEACWHKMEECGFVVDTVLSHTCPYKYIPREAFLPMINQDSVDDSTEKWLDNIESRLYYERWYCGHWHISKRVDKLHFLFHDVKYRGLAEVEGDFVELPSQLMENWATEKEFLDLWAVHYETGEPMPAEIVDRIVAAQNYLAAYANVRQLSFGMTDMAWHTLTEPFEGDVEQFEAVSMAPTQVLPVVPGTAMAPAFGHIFSGGYAAGYYGYKWAEVLEADAFSLFKEKGIFNREAASSFRENVLAKGGTEHPMELYVRFRGHKPETRALIEKMGLGK